MKEILEYYRRAGDITSLERHKEILIKITNNPEFLCNIVQGILLHDNTFVFYKTPYRQDLQIHPVEIADLVDEVLKIDPDFLTTPRIPQKRIITSCREYAVLTCALLRAKEISSRCRCGFPLYINLDNGRLADHWATEYWDNEKWILFDSQVDAMQLSAFQRKGMIEVEPYESAKRQYGFPNPHNLKEEDFILAGRAWLFVRNGILPPERFGYIHSSGLSYIRGQLLRDFGALNKVEIQTHYAVINQGYDWSSWRLIHGSDDELSENDYRLLDYIAELTLNADENYAEIRRLYAQENELRIPESMLRNKRNGASEVPKQVFLELME